VQPKLSQKSVSVSCTYKKEYSFFILIKNDISRLAQIMAAPQIIDTYKSNKYFNIKTYVFSAIGNQQRIRRPHHPPMVAIDSETGNCTLPFSASKPSFARWLRAEIKVVFNCSSVAPARIKSRTLKTPLS